MKPVKQVIVMRTDLGMRKGKMIAQGAHASMGFLKQLLDASDFGFSGALEISPQESKWLSDLCTKICVRVESEEELMTIHRSALKAEIKSVLIQDAGLTEFGGVPTYTCLALGPDEAAKIDLITGHLQLL